jgi:hypothetical protein
MMISKIDVICIINANRAIYICAIGIVFPRWVRSPPRLLHDDSGL